MNQRAGSKKRVRTRRLTERFFRILALISILSILAIVFLITRVLVTYQQSRKTYLSIANQVVSTQEPISQAQPSPDTEGAHSSFEREYQPVMDSDIEYKPIETVPITVDWVSLRATNKQIVAWLYCEGTHINYPVLQGKDNTYYLTHNLFKKADQAGGLFLDHRNKLGNTLQNLIIYGHRMKDGSMFGELAKFADKSYCDKHASFYLLTPDQNYKMDTIACRTVHGESKYFPTSFTDVDAEDRYISKARSQSYWQELPQKKQDGAILLTLATCSKYDFSDSPRLILHGWAIPIN